MRSLADPDAVAALDARLARLAPDTPRRWGRMSAGEMLCHLAEAFRHSLGELPPTPADSLWTRTVIKWAALWLPVPWPHGYRTPAIVNPQREGRRPGEFEQDRRTLVIAMRRFIDGARAGRTQAHPIFGPMSTTEWLRWAWLHMDHHLRQFGL